jgi:hypothetical protein
MARVADAVAEALMPLHDLIIARHAKCEVLCAYETRLWGGRRAFLAGLRYDSGVFKESGIKKDGLSYMWIVAGTHEGHNLVRFHYGGGRDSRIAKELLRDFKGIPM